VADSDSDESEEDAGRGLSDLPGWVARVVQVIIVVIGLGGAILHGFFDEHYASHLDVDLTSVAWIGVALIGILLPSIASVEFGDVKIQLRKLRKGAADIDAALVDAANLAQNWATSAAIFLNMMQTPASELLESRDAIFGKYLRDRMGEAIGFLGDKPGDTIRIAVWFYDADTRELRYGNISVGGAPPTKREYKAGEGMIGQAFVENFFERRTFNEADARVVPSYKNTREGSEPPYKAVLCMPIRWSNSPIGMITVDKGTPLYFSQVAEDVARGLASQCALALTQYTRAIALDSSV